MTATLLERAVVDTDHELIEAVKILSLGRKAQVREFLTLLDNSDGLVMKAMAWIVDHLPDRYCAGEPRFDVHALNWRVPILLSYPNGQGGEVGELKFDARTQELDEHTALDEIRARGRQIADEFQNAK